MKTYLSIFAFGILFVACDSTTDNNNGLVAQFTITDTMGNQSTTIHTGDNFDLHLSIANSTGKSQTYHYSGGFVVFEIRSKDSLICTSMDGLAWVQNVSTAFIENNKSLVDSWRAPNSAARVSKVVLDPGTYTARATLHMSFDEAKLSNPSDIVFNVTQ